MKYYWLFFLLNLIFIKITFSQSSPLTAIHAVKLETQLEVDGILGEALYSQKAIDNFTQKEPVEGSPVSENTKLWIFYDESNIYFSGKFNDTHPDSIDRSLMRRDNLVESDWVWIYLDPFNDDRTGNYFAVNAGGSICDGTLFNDGDMDDSWDGIWQAETNIDDEGWTFEIKIPFSQLRFNLSDQMVWGINLNRDIKRKHEMAFLVMVPKAESGFISRFVDLKGLNGISSKQRIELLPYIVQKAQYLQGKENDPFYKSNQYKTTFGGDIKFSAGSNLNFDFTINPDFGQVEVDPAIVNLTDFENYYSEKRPFFIEGNNIFDYGSGAANSFWGFNFTIPGLYYSRRIGRKPQGYTTTDGYVSYPNETRILGAGKLSGKIDPSWSIGILSAFSERTYARVYTPDNRTVYDEVEPFTNYTVLRTLKEFDNGRNGLGVIFTGVNRNLRDNILKDQLVSNAYTFGVDGWTHLDDDKIYVLTGTVVGSYVSGTEEAIINKQKQPYRYFQRPDFNFMPLDSNLTSLSGVFSRFTINKQEGNFYLNTSIGIMTPGFEFNDMGFQSFADRINAHFIAGYRWYTPDDFSRKKSIYAAVHRTINFDNDNIKTGFYFRGTWMFLNFWSIASNFTYSPPSVSTSLTRGGPKTIVPTSYVFNFSGMTDSRSKIIFSPNLSLQKTGSSGTFYLGLLTEYKPQPNLSLSIEPEFSYSNSDRQWVKAVSDENAEDTFGKRYVFSDMKQNSLTINFRINWSITPKMSIQCYLQSLISSGDYDKFKELRYANSEDFLIYGTDNSSITFDEDENIYSVIPDYAQSTGPFSIYNPDFNYSSLRSNLVFRWEVRPGSVFYFAWTHDRMNLRESGNFEPTDSFSELIKIPSDNVFLLKFFYWFDI